jgi:hypothetical protein
MHIRIVVDRLGVATMFPAVQAGLDFALKRGKIALNNLLCAVVSINFKCYPKIFLYCGRLVDGAGGFLWE